MTKTHWRDALLSALLLVTLVPAALAQRTVGAAVLPEAGCLTHTAGTGARPHYPDELYDRKESAQVEARLTFEGAAAAPKVEFELDEPGRHVATGFREAIRDFARGLRVPCMGKDAASVTLRQTYVFTPTDGRRVFWAHPSDPAEQRKAELGRCLVNARPVPAYPRDAVERGWQGTIPVKLVFDHADKPPSAQVLDEGGAFGISSSLLRYAADYRLPCLTNGKLELVVFYKFRIDGEDRTVLRDMSLVSFLRATKDIEKANVYFDTHAMGCPFDVRLTVRMPYAPNVVVEVGTTHPERRFMLDWLASRTLDLPERTMRRVLHDFTTITVPCLVVNLEPEPQAGGPASK